MPILTHGALRFEAPESFTDATMITLLGPVEDGFRANVLITRDAEPEAGLDAYVDAQSEDFATRAPGYALHRRAARRLAGREGLTVEQSFDSSDGTRLRQLQAFVGVDGEIHAISMTHLEACFEAVRPSFDALLDTLELGASADPAQSPT
jgi:hypothetical protein